MANSIDFSGPEMVQKSYFYRQLKFQGGGTKSGCPRHRFFVTAVLNLVPAHPRSVNIGEIILDLS